MPDVGEIMGRYTLLKKLAVGGMGEIFLAAKSGPLGMGMPIALKVLRDEFTQDQNFVDMLVDEANICRFLNHQNVVSVTDFGQDLGTYFIAMEYVQGVTLQFILEQLRESRKRMPLGLSLYIQMELCRALRYAHTKKDYAGEPLNIIHRDVTPGNLLLSIQGEVKLTDFGIARAKGRNHKTQAGILKGKFGYMAPEMIRQEEIDSRADIFCAGIVLYEMLATRHPVHGASLIEAITAFEKQSYKPPSAYNKQLPAVLDEIVMKALAPQPNSRWSSAEEFANELQSLIVSDKSIRNMASSGGPYLSKLIKKFNQEIFENQIPDLSGQGVKSNEWNVAAAKSRNPLDITPSLSSQSHDDTLNSFSNAADDSERPTAHVLDGINEAKPAPSSARPTTNERSGQTNEPSPNSGNEEIGQGLSEEATIDASDMDPQELQQLMSAGMGDQDVTLPPDDGHNSTLMTTPSEVAEQTTGTPLLQGSEVRPVFEEGLIAPTPNSAPATSDYDDGPTAFTAAPEQELIAAATAAASQTQTEAPADDYNDATLLDGLSLADVEAAKQQYEQEQEQEQKQEQEQEQKQEQEAFAEPVKPKVTSASGPQATPPDPDGSTAETDDNIDATRIRFDIGDLAQETPSALAQISATAKELSGPLRIKMTNQEVVSEEEANTALAMSVEPPAPATLPSAPSQADGQTPLSTSEGIANTLIPMPAHPATAETDLPDEENVPATAFTPQPDFSSMAPPPAPASTPQVQAPVGQPPVPVNTGKSSKLLPIVTVFVVLAVAISCFLLISDRFWPRVTLVTEPSGANITLNDRQTRGQSPVTLKLKPFVTHKLSFQLPGHKIKTLDYRGSLTSQKVINVQLIASEHYIIVRPRPGRIFINDRKIGTSDRLELPALDAVGQIEIKVEATGYVTWTRTYKSAAEVPYEIKATLTEK